MANIVGGESSNETSENIISKWKLYQAVEDIEKGLVREEIRKQLNQRKRKIQRAKTNNKFQFRGNIMIKITAILLAGIAVVGGCQAKNEIDKFKQQNEPPRLELVMKSGESTDSLGINDDIVFEIKNIEELLEEEMLKNEELIRLSARISSLQFDTVKAKLSNALGVPAEKISIYRKYIGKGETSEGVGIKNDKVYTNNFLKFNHKISSELAEYIREIARMQDTMKEMQEGNINRNVILEEYKEAIKKTSQFAAADVTVDDNDNILVKYRNICDLNNQLNQKEYEGEER